MIQSRMIQSPGRRMRKGTRCALAICAALFLVFCALPATARATTIAKMSLAKMSQAAKAIARVRCLSNSTIWDSGEIWTLTTFEVQQTWRGTLPAEIAVRLLGGGLANITSTVSGVPRFRPGEEAVLFLEPTARGDFSVVAWQQGTFRIHRNNQSGEETITQDTASFPALVPNHGQNLDPRSRRPEMGGIAGMPVTTFRSRVEIALSEASGTAQ